MLVLMNVNHNIKMQDKILHIKKLNKKNVFIAEGSKIIGDVEINDFKYMV